jgi:hypothetical protein
MYAVVGVKETLETFNFAPTFEPVDGITVADVVRFEEAPKW